MRRDTLNHATIACLPPRIRMDTASNLWTTLNTRLLCVHRNMWQSCDSHVSHLSHVTVMWQSCDVHVSHALSPFGSTLQLSTALQVSIFCLLEATWYQDLSILPAVYAYQILEAAKVYETWLTPVTTEVLLQRSVQFNFAKIRTRVSLFFSFSYETMRTCLYFLSSFGKVSGEGVWLACFYF